MDMLVERRRDPTTQASLQPAVLTYDDMAWYSKHEYQIQRRIVCMNLLEVATVTLHYEVA